MHSTSTRRHILAGLTTTGLAALLDTRRASSEEAPLDTTTVRFSKSPGICNAPQFVAEDLLRADGFSDFRYVDAVAGLTATAISHSAVRSNRHSPPRRMSGESWRPLTSSVFSPLRRT